MTFFIVPTNLRFEFRSTDLKTPWRFRVIPRFLLGMLRLRSREINETGLKLRSFLDLYPNFRHRS